MYFYNHTMNRLDHQKDSSKCQKSWSLVTRPVVTGVLT